MFMYKIFYLHNFVDFLKIHNFVLFRMREAGIDIKKMVEGYLKSLKSEESEDIKSPSWEMNNCELTTADEGTYTFKMTIFKIRFL